MLVTVLYYHRWILWRKEQNDDKISNKTTEMFVGMLNFHFLAKIKKKKKKKKKTYKTESNFKKTFNIYFWVPNKQLENVIY